MTQQITLYQLNEMIKNALTEAFPSTIWVIAEVSELKENRSGHCYLELIEKEGNSIIARTRATIWSYTYRMLKPYFETATKQAFVAGIKILVQVSVEYHPAFGLSLNIKDIDPTYTVGDMALQRQEVIKQLKAEGVFEMNRELALPEVPQKIAVISSATAAGYQDFIDQLQNNDLGIRFYTKLFEAYMQGEEAVPSIIHALERIFRYEDFFDVVVVIRGGGATADLSSFDNYDLAFNITQFPLPVITGIGHEKDDTIIDMVAHTRMKTPTAVAEFLINGVERFYEKLIVFQNEFVRLTRNTIDFQRNRLERIAEGLGYSISEFINEKNNSLNKKGSEIHQSVNKFSYQKKYELNALKHEMESAVSLWFVDKRNSIDQTRMRLKQTVKDVIFNKLNHLTYAKQTFKRESMNIISKEKERIHLNENTIRLLNPENVLKRGYTITLKDGKIVKKAVHLKLEDEIETKFSDGYVNSKISKKRR